MTFFSGIDKPRTDTSTTRSFAAALRAFENGRPILIHDADDREGETDLVYPARSVTAADVTRMRNDAGGLICVAFSNDVAEAFDLPFVKDVLDHPATEGHELNYDQRSSFSLTVNHRDTFTGVTDEDRALTIRKLAVAADDHTRTDFAAEFRVPGHVNILRAAPNLLADRRGHTELGMALAAAARQAPVVVVCEMLDDVTGGALSPSDAKQYAHRNGTQYVEGSTVVARLG